jgi:hypothetical protein
MVLIVRGSDCALLCGDKQREVPANLLLHLILISIVTHDFYSLRQASAHSIKVMNQTMFDVPDPLVVLAM